MGKLALDNGDHIDADKMPDSVQAAGREAQSTFIEMAKAYGYTGIAAILPHETVTERVTQAMDSKDFAGLLIGFYLYQNRIAFDLAAKDWEINRLKESINDFLSFYGNYVTDIVQADGKSLLEDISSHIEQLEKVVGDE